MARGKNQVTLTFAGDATDLEKAFDKVGSAADGMADDVKQATDKIGRNTADSFDSVGESAGALDTRAMGFRDTMTGVQDTMSGWSKLMKGDVAGGLFELGAGVGDLASGVENLVVPLAKAAQQHARTAALWVVNHAKMAASTVATAVKIAVTWAINAAKAAASVVASVARQVAAWALLGVQSLIHAAKVAAAWLISIGPIALVIAAVVALVIVIIKNWDHIVAAFEWAYNWLKRATSAAWDFIKATFSRALAGISAVVSFYLNLYKRIFSVAWTVIKTVTRVAFNAVKSVITNIMNAVKNDIRSKINSAVGLFRGLAGRLRSALSTVSSAITAPFRRGFAAIRNLWNRLIGGKGFSVPSWVPGVGGRSFRIPRLAEGGVVNRPTLALIGEAGPEAVVPLTPRNNPAAGGMATIRIESGGTAMDDLLVEILRKSIANRGGGVVAVLG